MQPSLFYLMANQSLVIMLGSGRDGDSVIYCLLSENNIGS